MNRLAQSGVELAGDVLREESLKLFHSWRRGEKRPLKQGECSKEAILRTSLDHFRE